jgi:hypothetical protein
MWQSIKNWFTKTQQRSNPTAESKIKKIKKLELTAKEQATAAGQPYVNIISLDLDPANPNIGSVELDWNALFINQLIQMGYRGASDEQIVDQWFQTVCRNILMETWEQELADPSKRAVQRRDLGNGRTEIS